jgi:Ca2+/H+ antiporter
MVALLRHKTATENIREMGPALAILLGTLIISIFITEFTFTFGLNAAWKTLFRFLRLSFVLAIPLFLLPAICAAAQGVLNRGNRQLVRVQEDRDSAIHPLQTWVIRPFQGIGLGMLLATKLLTFLQLYGGATITAETILPPGQFHVGRFISATAISIVVSLLLSFLWALDDLGVRYYNRKTGEVRMIGKYIGLLLPIFFGFYGIFSLFDEYDRLQAALYIAQMVIVLYPPFVVFSVLHSRYLNSREDKLLEKLKAAEDVIWADRGAPAASKI